MLTIEKQKQFAELAVRIGANMQEGQEVVIRCDVKCKDFAHLIAEKAYEFGAKRVHLEWRDETLSRITFLNASTETLTEIPSYTIEQMKYFVEHKVCLISIASGDPNIFKGVDADKLMKVNIASSKALKFFRQATMSNLLRWTIVSIPTAAWAKAVFPEVSEEVAVDKLWDAIAKTMRLDTADPVAAWKTHIATLKRRAKLLTDKNFKEVRLTSANGTDLTIDLAEDHLWIAAEEDGQDGVPFTANMPTEEVFTAPHRQRINGVVKNALPLVNNGNIIDDFSITFKDGKVVDYSAGKGYETLKGLLSADEGVLSLGELALIGKNSPISELGILFYNTLFDENASCHLAFGQGYPTTIKNGNDLTQEELRAKGLNESTQHVDFMIGSKDMNIVGIGYDGSETQLFVDGEWVV
jgi:aminopeptidase